MGSSRAGTDSSGLVSDWLSLERSCPCVQAVALFWVFGVSKAYLACISEACDHPFWLTDISVLGSSNGSPYQKSELASEGINQSLQSPLTPVVCTPGQTHCFALFPSTKAVAPIILIPGTGFLWLQVGGDGFGVIQVHYIYCVLYFYYYYISSTSHLQPLDPGGWGPLLYGVEPSFRIWL